MAWNDDENAPQPGVSLCRIEDVPEGQGREFVFGVSGFPFCMFMVRKGETIRGYVNSCPHTGAPLNWSPDEFTSEDGQLIICSTHGALFEMENGYCSFGPCKGDYLEPVPVQTHGGLVVIGNGPDKEER